MIRNEIALVRQTPGAALEQIGETTGKLARLAEEITRLLGQAFNPALPASDVDAGIVLDWLNSGKKANSPNTRREYLRDLCGPKIGFLLFVESKPLYTVTRDDFTKYAEALRAAEIPATDRRTAHKLSIATQRRMLAAVKGLFTHANGLGLIPFNPGKAIALPSLPEKKRDKALTRAQSLKLQAAAEMRASQAETHQTTRSRDALLSQTLYLTGARISEALNLVWADLYATDKGAELKIRHGKGDKERVVSIPGDLYADLLAMKAERQAAEDAPVFLSQKGSRLSIAQAGRIIRKVAEAAQIQRRVTPHTMRHSIATQLLDGGAPLHGVSEFLGHSDPKITIKAYYSAESALDVSSYLK